MTERLPLTRDLSLYAKESRWLRKLPLNHEFVEEENIDKIRELLSEGKNVVAILDHRSLADTASGAIAAFKNEKLNELVKDTVIVIKLKYTEQFPTGFLLQSVRTIPVISPTMEDDARKDDVNRIAIRTAKKLPNGTLLIITPEATRVNTGKMEKARKEAASFWNRTNETWLAPIALEKMEKQWPPGKLGTLRYVSGIGPIFYKARFIFGQPIKVDELKLIARTLTKGDSKKYKQFQVDLAMRQIAILHYAQGESRYVDNGYYEIFMTDLGEKSWLFLKPEEIISARSAEGKH